MKNFKIGIAQINTTVGDIQGNAKKVISYMNKAKEKGIDILTFPELTTVGYPPEDLLLKTKIIEDNLKSLNLIIKQTQGIAVIIGFVDKKDNQIFNAAALISNCKLIGVHHKVKLPNYGVFDEKRYFKEGKKCATYEFMEEEFAVNICEDIWQEDEPLSTQVNLGAKVVLNISASPYYFGKTKDREEILKKRAIENNVNIIYTNLIGGQDELIFDGGSIGLNEKGEIMVKAPQFKEELIITEFKNGNLVKGVIAPYLSDEEEILQSLIFGTREYCLKNGFKKVCLGLSGGIDSSLTAVVATHSLGAENVVGVFMPSQYTSDESYQDAKELAKNLKIKFLEIPIKDTFLAYKNMLKKVFQGTKEDITEENIQARIRGNILMALSNKFGYLVLTTGNKSEMSVGYATLYGDMAGGFAVIKDLSKTMVYKVSRWLNKKEVVIPSRVLIKEPTAELKEGQKDTDTLPPYSELDPILHYYIEEDKSCDEIIKLGFKEDVVKKIINMVDKNEYKRRQAPLGIKITPKAFGKDRRMPVVNKYME
jgi:NAD+ synthase (glutamine-hydrolysing)